MGFLNMFGSEKDKDKNEEKSKEKDSESEEESEEEYEDENTYTTSIECDNCGSEFEFDIPKGTTIKTFLIDEKCDDCGCLIKEEK